MPLIIEDGTGVAGANSYATVAEARAYAAARGLSLPASDAAVETALVLACDFLEGFNYRGTKTSASQSLQWPRADVYVDDAEDALDSDEIPAKLKLAQCQLAFDSTQNELQPTGTGREVIREKVDVIEVQYAERKSGTIQPQFNKAESILAPLLKSGAGFGLTVSRA